MEFAIDWERTPLVPVIVQERGSGQVLMLAYMNEEALRKTLESGYAHYYSRSRQRLWKKGEKSGNYQKVHSIKLDCDNDAILLEVEQHGSACHTGRLSCFYKDLTTQSVTAQPIQDPDQLYTDILDRLYHVIQERKEADPTKSWTAKLFHRGEDAILKKVIEEAGEVALAIKGKKQEEIVHEGADLLYHLLVALAWANISPELLYAELRRRFGRSGIEEKAQRRDR
ncbi:MAG: bifunctional phosphoribosyl-AMP cyclohydrolase/phosphoribosyl-ATP pyrophosphatase [Nitratiruptor sp.]|nr:bifunctional phosphoribosyl-AMP cyclohydrolase/phosphoribosyl-ATP pyrophosphatase [Nitratiruptor sp.]NPA83039.1 bifunctional phosphoribosyl-AMP cyclohydrolase/phosphoribosyl-ATP diphosphatase HisIE [Campylobacterota bacterium]